MASEVVFWRGECWYLYDGYYKNRRGELLHREIYIDAHGPIGDDVEVYHRDEDKSNWALDNLESGPSASRYDALTYPRSAEPPVCPHCRLLRPQDCRPGRGRLAG